MSAEQWAGAFLAGLSVACVIAYCWWLGSQLDQARQRILDLEAEKACLRRQLRRTGELNNWLRGRVVRRRG